MKKGFFRGLAERLGGIFAPIPDELPHALVSALIIAEQKGSLAIIPEQENALATLDNGTQVQLGWSGEPYKPYQVKVRDNNGNQCHVYKNPEGEVIQAYPMSADLGGVVEVIKLWGTIAPCGPFVRQECDPAPVHIIHPQLP